MYFVLVAWTFWTFFTMYLTFTNWIAFSWVLFCTLTFILVSRYTDGIQQMEISLHHFLEGKKTKAVSSSKGRKSKDSTTSILESNGNTINTAIFGSGDHKLD
jgi:hypothetical protein